MKCRVREPLVKAVFLLFSTLLASPLVAAREFHTGVSPLNRVLGFMAWMFDTPILQNEHVQLGFVKFCLFILFLAVSRAAFKKFFDNKTAGIIATVFSLIAAFLMPKSLVVANGSVIMIVLTGLVPLGVVGGGVYFCVTRLNKNTITRLLAIVILVVLLAIVEVYHNIVDKWTTLSYLILLIPAKWLRRWR